MTFPVKDTEAELAYCESEMGCALVVESAGVYGARRAFDGVKVVTAQAISAMGTRNVKINPKIKDHTG